MTGESTRSISVKPCTYISNGLYLSPCATKFDSLLAVTDSLSYILVANFAEPSQFISDISYIDTYPIQTPTKRQRPPTSTQTTTHSTSTLNNNNTIQPPLLCHSDRVGQNSDIQQFNSAVTDTVPIHLSTKKKYKPVALKVKPHIGTLPDKFRIIRQIIGDPLKDLPTLPTNPPTFTPTGRYTEERKEIFNKINAGFLLPLERDLLHYFMMIHNDAFAWETSERGHFREDFFPPVDIPVIPHKPWVQRNSRIPPGLYNEFCQLVKDKT